MRWKYLGAAMTTSLAAITLGAIALERLMSLEVDGFKGELGVCCDWPGMHAVRRWSGHLI